VFYLDYLWIPASDVLLSPEPLELPTGTIEESKVPSLSKSGTEVAYLSNRAPDGTLGLSRRYIYLDDGNRSVLLTEAPDESSSFSPYDDLRWNPAQRQIGVITSLPGELLEVTDVVTGEQLDIDIYAGQEILEVIDVATGEQLMATDIPINSGQLSWHPDGDRIALFTLETDYVDSVTVSEQEIYVVDETRAQTTLLEPPTHCVMSIEWSPDGSRLGWSMAEEEHWQITIYDLASRELSSLPSGQAEHLYPTWSPDGAQIAYLKLRAENDVDDEQQQVCWIELATLHESCVTQVLTEHPSIPTWSPDGEWLAYYVEQQNNYRIDVVNVTEMQRKTIVVFTNE